MQYNWRQLRDISQETALSPNFIRGILGADAFPVDIETLVESLGIDLALLKSADNCSYLAATRCSDLNAIIWFHEGLCPERIRFVIAHELGHLLLHYNQEEFTDLEFANDNKEDREANRFALDLLIPTYAMEEFFSVLKGFDVEEMSKKFGVTQSIVIGRITESREPAKFHNKFESNVTPFVLEDLTDLDL